MRFQSTLPRGERHLSFLDADTQYNFNPRSREGSDDSTPSYLQEYLISIHAPARGATAKSVGSLKAVVISIHAPARGATKASCFSSHLYSHFNPRSREGSDVGENLKLLKGDISIHAPARGATFRKRHSIVHILISIHAPARGATQTDYNDQT